MHDEDIYPGDPSELSQWQREENERAPKQNAEIQTAAGPEAIVHIHQPTLEFALGIGRSARDKPRAVLEKLQGLDVGEVPRPLVDAVKNLAVKTATSVQLDTDENPQSY